ncbi:MAG: DNA repair protein RecO [Myxococcales bacterium]|jgi:DNA repair protein RecO (recombination protein O)
MERFRCRAVVLSAVDYADSDKVVTLLTDERGKVAVFARGARKSRRRFAGALEPFSLLEVQLCETRGDTFRLDGVELLDGFGELRGDLARIARAACAAELVRELCREREPQPALFALLCRYLQALARGGAGPLTLMRFELAALAHAGLMPQLDRCARCGGRVPEDALFDPEHGGVLCAACAPSLGARISAEAARALATLQRAQAGTSLELPAPVRAEARAVLSGFVAHHLGRRLKSYEFMREMGIEA